MKISFFGKLRDALGGELDLVETQGETVAQLRKRLAELFPPAGDNLLGAGVRAFVDDTIVDEDFVVAGHDRVEFLPPLSGG